MPPTRTPTRAPSKTHQPMPFVAPDLSGFARALGSALKERHATKTEPPGHVETLNLVARALGHRNAQSLRAALRSAPKLASAAPAPMALSDNARKALSQFDEQGRLVRWPNKFTVQRMAMWVLWTNFEAKRLYTEKEVNTILKALNAFGDHVTLRRELINHKLLARKSDCSEYRKLPARPDDETRALMQAWRGLMRQRPKAASLPLTAAPQPSAELSLQKALNRRARKQPAKGLPMP